MSEISRQVGVITTGVGKAIKRVYHETKLNEVDDITLVGLEAKKALEAKKMRKEKYREL